jgi:hypothetical protein
VVKAKSTEWPRSYTVELEEGRCLERNRVKIRKVEKVERPANERKVSPMLTFSQALPSIEAAPRPRWGALISTENDPGMSLDQEMNSQESTTREDSGPSTSPDSQPPAPSTKPPAKKKKTSAKDPEYISVANTRSGRPVKDPDRLIVSM